MACADAGDRDNYLRTTMRHLLRSNGIQHKISIYSKELYDTIPTSHEGQKYRLR